MYGAGGRGEITVELALPVDIEDDQLLESEGFHIGMVDHIETEIEQRLVFASLTLQQRADVEFQLVKYLFVDITVRVDQVSEQLIFLDGVKMLFLDLNTPCTR